jgi:hypothetical protein
LGFSTDGAPIRGFDDETCALQDLQECGSDPSDRVVVHVEVQPAVGRKAEDRGSTGAKLEGR